MFRQTLIIAIGLLTVGCGQVPEENTQEVVTRTYNCEVLSEDHVIEPFSIEVGADSVTQMLDGRSATYPALVTGDGVMWWTPGAPLHHALGTDGMLHVTHAASDQGMVNIPPPENGDQLSASETDAYYRAKLVESGLDLVEEFRASCSTVAP